MRLKRTGILTKIIILILIIYAVTSLVKLTARIDSAEKKNAELQQAAANITAEIDDMQHAIDNKDDESVLREIARMLGLIDPDEEVFYAG